jgi:hypothetical protein
MRKQCKKRFDTTVSKVAKRLTFHHIQFQFRTNSPVHRSALPFFVTPVTLAA